MDTKPAALLDLDGTLVDSIYHHVIAWQDALREAGYDVPAARIHAGIGMGGDRLVPWLLGGHVEDADALGDGHETRFLARAEDLRPTPGAVALLEDLRTREVDFIIATSAGAATREALLDVLGEHDVPLVGAGEHDSKPSPDILIAACEQVGTTPDRAVLLGDAPWDAVAARRIGMLSIAVRCGGFGDDLLRESGFSRIVDDPRGVIGQL